jgi:hypothetical protein
MAPTTKPRWKGIIIKMLLSRHHHEKDFERAVPFGMFLILGIDAQKRITLLRHRFGQKKCK